MDGLKIVETPIGSTYPYLGVFHQLVGSAFDTYAAYSTDLKTWHLLGTIRGGTSGQPDIRILPDKSVLVAYEMPSFFTSHITVKYYSSVDSFITNPSGATATIDLPMVPGNQNNVTPVFGTIIYNGNIYDSTIQITHHWRNQRSMDQVAIGYLTNFSSWTSSSDNAVNNKLAALGRLQVGDRDVFQVGDTVYEIVEANAHEPIGNSGWDTWRNYLINRGSSGLEVLDTRKLVPIIPGGAYSLGNPTASFLHLPDGRPALAFTHYLFYQGAANTPAGPHLYVYPLSTSYIAPTSTTPTPLPLRTGALTVTLTANGVTNPTVAEGDSHTLEWYSANASSCTLSYSLPGVSTIGTISLIPNAAGSGTSQAGGTRTITCIGTYGTTITKTITITVTPPITATSNSPRGYIESSTYATITGWAQDQDIPDSPIDVHFYIDKPPTDTDFSGYAGMVSAKDYRADLCNEIGSCNHAFLFTVPAKFKDGLAHTVYAYGMDEDGVGAHNLALIPYASTSNIFQYLAATTTTSTATLTAGKQSVVSGETVILVWESTNTSSCTGTNFYTGGKRFGLAGPYPKATTTYSITCAGNDDTSPTASVTVGVGAATTNIFYPRGYIESSNYATITGWAQARDIPDSPIDVHIYIDKPPTATDFSGYVGMVSAKDYRSDLCTNAGSCNHAFTFTTPTKYQDGILHTVYAYGMDEDGVGAHNSALTPYSSTSNTFKYLAVTTSAPTITITGTGFNATQNLVFLGGIGGLCGLSYLTSTASGTSIACTLGLGGWSTGTYSLTVKNVTTGLTSTGVNFTVSAPRVLSITTVSPTSGIAGSTLTLTGTGFDANTSVRFSGTSGAYATVSSYTSTSIVVTVPTLAPGSYSVYASNASGNSASLTYSITTSIGAPTITSISPSSGSGSVPIVITGTGFNATQNLIFLGGIGGLCGLSYLTSTASGTSIACTLGLGGWSAGTYSLTVKNVTTGLTSTGVNFTVSAPRVLSITTVSPTSGFAGSTLTLTGTGFDANTSVRFSGTSGAYATVSSYTSTSIVATVPTLAPGSYSVYASNASGNSASLTYSITASTGAPTITSISPSSGSGSVPITITGTGFNATQNLVFLGGIGGLCGLSYLTSTASGTSIACTLGLGRWSTGTYSLTVKNVTTGLTSTGVNFTVNSSEALSPEVLSITTVSPTSGIAGSTLTLTGTRFDANTSVRFSGTSGAYATVSSYTSTSIVATVPTLAPGSYSVYASNASGNSASLTYSITASTGAPTITSI